MKTPQLILAALLLATPLLYAQETPAKTETKPTPEPFRITINLKTTEKGKITGQKSYMLTAITEQRSDNPQIRDTNDVPLPTGGNPPGSVCYRGTVSDDCEFKYSRSGTNVDISNFRTVANLVFLSLRIWAADAADSPIVYQTRPTKAQDFTPSKLDDLVGNGVVTKPSSLPLPIYHERSFVINPTLPIGKLVTVYSAADAVNDTRIEVQVMVQPLDAK